MTSFNIETRIFDAFPIREHPHGTASDTDRLKIVANKYVPKNNLHPSAGDLTIICAHANGFHKELYEPFFDYLVEPCEKLGVKFRAIWALDVHHQGASGVLNEKILGGQISWFDNCRDVLAMISQAPHEFQVPMIGIGHSMGGCILFRTSVMHPTLFAGLVGLDPVINPLTGDPLDAAKLSIRRRDIWPTREAAAAYFHSRPFYQAWDPRCLDLHMKYGLRELPSAIYPNEKGLTLTTTKHMEVLTFISQKQIRTEAAEMFRLLPEIKVPVFYVQGETSFVNLPGVNGSKSTNEMKMERTPQPCEMYVMKDTGHLVPMERPQLCAEVVAPWIAKTIKRWGKAREEEKRLYPSTLLCPPHLVSADAKYKL